MAMTSPTGIKDAAAGCAALAICESLLLALTELKILGDNDARGILEDAAATHRGTECTAPDAAIRYEAAHMIENIISVRSSLPRRNP